MFARLLVLGAVMLAAGCASSHVLVGQVRPPIKPEEVKLYLRPPEKFEEIAILESSSKNSFALGQQGKMNKAIARLKEEAARLGANGILLNGAGDQYAGSVNSGSATATTTADGTHAYGNGVAIPVMHKGATGIAIYVPNN